MYVWPPLLYERKTDGLAQGQEAEYMKKVDAVKAEHEQLLQEAFEKAKVYC